MMDIKAVADMTECESVWTTPGWCDVRHPSQRPSWREFADSLSVRSRRALGKLGITSFEQAATLTVRQLEATWGCGPTTTIEIRFALAQHGIFIQ